MSDSEKIRETFVEALVALPPFAKLMLVIGLGMIIAAAGIEVLDYHLPDNMHRAFAILGVIVLWIANDSNNKHKDRQLQEKIAIRSADVTLRREHEHLADKTQINSLDGSNGTSD